MWVALSPALRGRLHALDAALDLAQLRAFAQRFRPGQPLRCSVMQVRRMLHLNCLLAPVTVWWQLLVLECC